MQRRFSRYLLTIKLFSLCLSIFFLVQGMSADKSHFQNTPQGRFFIIEPFAEDYNQQLETIEQFLASNTGEAIGLATKQGDEIKLVLPAITDYQIYRTYLYSTSKSVPTQEGNPEIYYNNDYPPTPDPQGGKMHYTVSVIFFILAVFL